MPASARATIPVVEDAPEHIDVPTGMLKGTYRVKVASNGEASPGIALSDGPPELIQLDIMMPEMDGDGMCRRLKPDPGTQRIPVLLVTAKIEIGDELKAFALGAADHITRLVSPPVVAARIETQLALHDQRRAFESELGGRTAQPAKAQRLLVCRPGRAAESKDNETGMHVVRMGRYARLLGCRNGPLGPAMIVRFGTHGMQVGLQATLARIRKNLARCRECDQAVDAEVAKVTA